jgi:pimeloyl-ACP methyl ester carboxylesterase
LVSYARPVRPAPFLPAPTPTPEAKLASDEIPISSADGTTLAGVLDLPSGAKRPFPVVVFVPPGPSASRNFGGEGPDPMLPSLVRAFAARGYAVLRYDTRGIGKSDGSSRNAGWDDELADALAAIREAAGSDGVDPKRVFVAGYGSGADIALAAAAAVDVPVAGVVALAPTVIPYRACGAQLAESAAGARTPDEKAKADADFARTAGRISDEVVRDVAIDGKTYERNDGSWARTSYAHDPTALALRARVPLFVLHPGLPTCAETPEQTANYDERLRAVNPRATIVVASDLSATFGGRYDADSDVDTQAFFPYRFDASTATAIADWLDSPKSAAAPRSGFGPGAGVRLPPPPPPPAPDSGNGTSREMGLPNPHPSTPGGATPGPQPGQPELPSTLASPTPSPSPTPRS